MATRDCANRARGERRLSCVVPFCKHTHGRHKGEPPFNEWTEWICGEHWRLVDQRLKRLRTAIRRRAERLKTGAEYRRGWVHPRLVNALGSQRRIWRKMKRQAIERAMGIRG